MRTAMIAITTSSSIRVNPHRRDGRAELGIERTMECSSNGEGPGAWSRCLAQGPGSTPLSHHMVKQDAWPEGGMVAIVPRSPGTCDRSERATGLTLQLDLEWRPDMFSSPGALDGAIQNRSSLLGAPLDFLALGWTLILFKSSCLLLRRTSISAGGAELPPEQPPTHATRRVPPRSEIRRASTWGRDVLISDPAFPDHTPGIRG